VTRTPPRPDRAEVPESERADYDALVAARFTPYYAGEIHPKATSADYYGALLNTPAVVAALSRLGSTVLALGNRAQTWSAAEHELISLVLAFDLGYLPLLAYHTPHAVVSGVRLEAIEALRDGREEALTEDERRQVRYVRAVAGGGVDDALWDELVDRFGSVRGAIEYSLLVLILQLHLRMHQVLDVPGIDRGELDELLAGIRTGTFPLPAPNSAGGHRVRDRRAELDADS
jgi:hypothetical protein